MPTKEKSTNRDVRMEMRLNAEDKALLEAAAKLHGINVSAYVLSHSVPAARREVGSSNTLIFNNHDRDKFIKMLNSPPKPNSKLKKAMQRYKNLNA